MLYNNFIACIMTVAAFAMLDMVVNEQWTYIILPIGIILWGVFKFFDANDREYLESRGIDPDEFNAFFPDEYDNNYTYGRNRHQYNSNVNVYNKKNNVSVDKNTITWNSPTDGYRRDSSSPTYNGSFGGGFFQSQRRRDNPEYKGMVKKCKRNFKITIAKTEKDESKRERVHHSVNSI